MADEQSTTSCGSSKLLLNVKLLIASKRTAGKLVYKCKQVIRVKSSCIPSSKVHVKYNSVKSTHPNQDRHRQSIKITLKKTRIDPMLPKFFAKTYSYSARAESVVLQHTLKFLQRLTHKVQGLNLWFCNICLNFCKDLLM